MSKTINRLKEELDRTGATDIGVRIENQTHDDGCVRISLDDTGFCTDTRKLTKLLEFIPDNCYIELKEEGNSRFCAIVAAMGIWDCNTREDTVNPPDELKWQSSPDWDQSVTEKAKI